ncbi:alanine dehydrogenase [Paenibacillus harenae]|uniref:Alanine dehydrogenase n=1 Tax=Paenibacillus harenae TaxID=306543 RepID=A0ABT9U474_PAEHA|nr:alanine dehydrogenase [Paenibacillus harenae]MDQ0058898.1 alanine dehydrogenase [Paenibacillus harenae]MDQ0114441.1 alanine dehydrogenase [Paenibacillus harenae]
MEIGIPKEVKNGEHRVAIAPSGVHEFIRLGHQVFIERGAGEGSGIIDDQFAAAGAVIVPYSEDAWCRELVLKVKEPMLEEYAFFHEKLKLFTYLHLAAEPALTEALVKGKVTAIAYETVQLASGGLPLLTPMSDIAGRMAAQLGAQFLEKPHGGKGLLLGGIPGVKKGKVTIIGGGVVGTGAAQIALGLGAEVTILDTDLNRLRYLDERFGGRLRTLASGSRQVAEAVAEADLVIGAVLIPGARAPRLVGEDAVRAMGRGSVILDVAIDQGGIFETIDRITTHDAPVFERHGVLHYAVANIPGAVPQTATAALTNATLPYALELATKGARAALLGNAALGLGVNAMSGRITHEAVAAAHGLAYTPLQQCLESVSA